jgi:G6PDH family F420-dependent oxidoreductase
VEDARLFDVPDQAPPILISAFGEKAMELAVEIGDGLWQVGPAAEAMENYRAAGGEGPIWTQITFCWDRDVDEAIARAHRIWPNSAVPGQLSQDLRTVAHFEEAVEAVTPSTVAEKVPCGPDLGPVIEQARAAIDGGASHVYFHQIGDPAGEFLDVWAKELRPELP